MKTKKTTNQTTSHRNRSGRPTSRQVSVTRAIVAWYLSTYFGTSADLGLLPMFCDPGYVGAFAVRPDSVQRGDPGALFRVLIATAMFQRLRDVLVFNILRGISPRTVGELTSQRGLLAHAKATGCPHLKDLDALHRRCDLIKVAGRGTCRAHPSIACPLKSHTETLKRYGHFGKVPTSAALMLAAKSGSLPGLRDEVFRRTSDPGLRAELLTSELTRIWRVSDKISAMYLSALTNRDLGFGLAPWTTGIDSGFFVVIDSNVDLFLGAVGYQGPRTYAARRNFIQGLAREIELAQLRDGLDSFNPRLVQQAIYSFMGRSNRQANSADCSRVAGACARCPTDLKKLCPVKPNYP